MLYPIDEDGNVVPDDIQIHGYRSDACSIEKAMDEFAKVIYNKFSSVSSDIERVYGASRNDLKINTIITDDIMLDMGGLWGDHHFTLVLEWVSGSFSKVSVSYRLNYYPWVQNTNIPDENTRRELADYLNETVMAYLSYGDCERTHVRKYILET